MEQILELLKSKDVHFPRVLLTNYKSLNITDLELIVLIYLMNCDSYTYNPKQISEDLNIKINEVLELMNNLTEKGIISIDFVKINKISNEIINLDLLYEKLAFKLLGDSKDTDDKSATFVEKFEKELGRDLLPMELEIIKGWISSNYSEEIIMCALKEAIYNGAQNSFRYIDRILFEWNKKGIKNKEDVEKNRLKFKESKNKKVEYFEWDWLNGKQDN